MYINITKLNPIVNFVVAMKWVQSMELQHVIF
jgi:hypothetical protein